MKKRLLLTMPPGERRVDTGERLHQGGPSRPSKGTKTLTSLFLYSLLFYYVRPQAFDRIHLAAHIRPHAFDRARVRVFHRSLYCAFRCTFERMFGRTFGRTSDRASHHTHDSTLDSTYDHTFDRTFERTVHHALYRTFDHLFDHLFDHAFDHTFDYAMHGRLEDTFDGTFNRALDNIFDHTLDPAFDHAFDLTSDRTSELLRSTSHLAAFPLVMKPPISDFPLPASYLSLRAPQPSSTISCYQSTTFRRPHRTPRFSYFLRPTSHVSPAIFRIPPFTSRSAPGTFIPPSFREGWDLRGSVGVLTLMAVAAMVIAQGAIIFPAAWHRLRLFPISLESPGCVVSGLWRLGSEEQGVGKGEWRAERGGAGSRKQNAIQFGKAAAAKKKPALENLLAMFSFAVLPPKSYPQKERKCRQQNANAASGEK